MRKECDKFYNAAEANGSEATWTGFKTSVQAEMI